jgi:hypothetical protein
MTWAAAWVLEIPVRGTLGAMWPGAATALGVAAGAGAIRLWSGLPAVPEIVLAILAGTAGGLAVLRLLAPAVLTELRHEAVGMIRRRSRPVVKDPAPST